MHKLVSIFPCSGIPRVSLGRQAVGCLAAFRPLIIGLTYTNLVSDKKAKQSGAALLHLYPTAGLLKPLSYAACHG